MSALGFQPLTPVSFLRRSALVFADRPAVLDDDVTLTYAELAAEVEALAGALAASGVEPGDRVALLCANTPLMLAAQFAVPLLRAVMVPLNIRLTGPELAAIAEHAGATLLLHDDALAELAAQVKVTTLGAAAIVEVASDAPPAPEPAPDEHALLSLNYTSGTTGRPKGVMYEHRGAYLQALAMAYHNAFGPESVYLWTLPMFHCNGWCLPWAVTAGGGAHATLRKIDPDDLWARIRRLGVTHMSAAPTVLISMAASPEAHPVEGAPLKVQTGGAPPTPDLLARLADLNVEVTHLYGLTETYGPSVVCQPQPSWKAEGPRELARLIARQGNVNVLGGELRVVGAGDVDVPADGEAMGEVVVRGNNTMLGYYRDDEATKAATLDGGWLRTGDLGVLHPDGYVELRDRAKDIVISGGENIASIEVEQAIASHPDVLEAAVVGKPHEKWGEVPVAFVTLRAGAERTADEIIAHVRSTLPGFKTPKEVVFGELPKTATGKVQKFALRERVGGT